MSAPAWLQDWLRPTTAKPRVTTTPIEHDEAGLSYLGQATAGPRFTHAVVRVRDAADEPDLGFERAAATAYRLVRDALDAGPARHPVRFWNFIPGIGHPADDAALDRYMVFNAGRFAAFAEWFDDPDQNHFAPRIATATGVGHAGPDLVVHALADRFPGVPVENPRQCAAYRYSPAYGPLPPCFARATRIASDGDGPPCVLVGGTSSIVGEASVHVGDVGAQTRETLDNIDALLDAADARGLDALHHLRVYHVYPADRDAILRDVAARLPHLAGRIEMVHAPLCRPDLAVEIEGIADAD
ncbi:MAG: pteridine-dependent deoxygenase like protein [Planctomycetota bacterium]